MPSSIQRPTSSSTVARLNVGRLSRSDSITLTITLRRCAPGLALHIPRGEDTAPFERFWGADHQPARPEDYAPADLGEIRLGPGLTLTGRVLDLAGKPIAGQPLGLTTRHNGWPSVAVTNADGRFRFALLRPGSYEIHGEGPDEHLLGCPVARQGLDQNRVIRPIDVYLKAGVEPAPVELREAETVLIQVQIEGAREEWPPGVFPKSAVGGRGGGPFSQFGERVSVHGTLANSAGVDKPDFGPGMIDGSEPSAKTAYNETPPDTRYGISWDVSGRADAGGRVTLRAIKGLLHARLRVHYQGPGRLAYKTRLGPGSPWRDTGEIRLNTLESDHRAIAVRGYRAATVVATIRTEGGEPPPADAQAQVDDLRESFPEGLDTSPYMEPEEHVGHDFVFFQKGADGTFRAEGLNPDHEYAFFARATGYVPRRIEHRSVQEGQSAELTLVMRKDAPPPAAGAPAPPFSVKRTDGRSLSLGDLRGKFVLVHIWSPFMVQGGDLIEPFRAVHDRFGKEERLVMLGFCLAHHPEGAARVIAARRIAWPQAVLRDALNDPIVQDYPQTGAVLIGPDGKVVARDVTGDKIGEVVARALGAR